MNKKEAKEILTRHLAEYRRENYSDLLRLLDDPEVLEVRASSGARYQLEFQAVWDDREQQNIRVIGSIDDGGLSALHPISDDFIMAPNGSLVGE